MTEEQRKQVIGIVTKNDLNDEETNEIRNIIFSTLRKNVSETVGNLCGIIMINNIQPEKRNTALIPDENIRGFIATLLLKEELYFSNDIFYTDFSSYSVMLDKPRI